jgi:hypothetical protein
VPANFISPYILMGLAAEHYAPSAYTDIAVDLMAGQAKQDGSFLTESGRAPLETGDIHLAATSIRALQLYASPAKKQRVETLVSHTKQWLERQQPSMQQEIAFQLMGLEWCGGSEALKTKVAGRLIALQNRDGGWSQLATLSSDAYATGQALYALFQSGTMNPGDPVYRKGVNFLLKTQDKTGAWIVATRSYPIQPFVDSEFPPFNHDQFISAAATSWSIMAVMFALPDAK